MKWQCMQTLLTKQNVGAVMLAGAISDERLQLEVLSALGNAAEKLLAGNSSGSSNVGCWSGAGIPLIEFATTLLSWGYWRQ